MSVQLKREYTPCSVETLASEVDIRLVVFFFAAHIPLALLMNKFNSVAWIHLIIILGIGLWWVATDDRVERGAYIGAYIVGAEVLWRMTGAVPVWETGKYMTAALFIVAMMLSACFFSHLRLLQQTLHRIFLSLIGPTVGVAAIACYGIVTTPNIEFGGSSNFETSGGFGTNQV